MQLFTSVGGCLIALTLCGSAHADPTNALNSAATSCDAWISNTANGLKIEKMDDWQTSSPSRYSNALYDLQMERVDQIGIDGDPTEPDMRSCYFTSQQGAFRIEKHLAVISFWEVWAADAGYQRWPEREKLYRREADEIELYTELFGVSDVPPLQYISLWRRCGITAHQIILVTVRDDISVTMQSLTTPVDERLSGCDITP